MKPHPHYQISQKSAPVTAALIYADRRTDMHREANSRFSQLCENAHGIIWNYEVRIRSYAF